MPSGCNRRAGRIKRLNSSRPAMGRTRQKAGDDVRRSDCRSVAPDRNVVRPGNLQASRTYLSQRALASGP